MSAEIQLQSVALARVLPRAKEGHGQVPWLGGLLLLSAALHVVAVAGIGHGRSGRRPRARPPTLVTMEVAKPEPPSQPRAPAPAPETPRAPRAARRVAAARPAHATVAEPRPAVATPEAETPADFTGVTLTNDGGGPGWASATGDGGAMKGPIGTAGRKVTGHSHDGATGEPGASSAGPPVLALGDLSRPPRAPLLDGVLERYYPPEARKRGVEGRAVLRVRIMPDGHVRDLTVLAESAAGFGEACRRTLRDSIWSAPLDREARPVSTILSYTCQFEVH